jgi:hypothetical protein
MAVKPFVMWPVAALSFAGVLWTAYWQLWLPNIVDMSFDHESKSDPKYGAYETYCLPGAFDACISHCSSKAEQNFCSEYNASTWARSWTNPTSVILFVALIFSGASAYYETIEPWRRRREAARERIEQ